MATNAVSRLSGNQPVALKRLESAINWVSRLHSERCKQVELRCSSVPSLSIEEYASAWRDLWQIRTISACSCVTPFITKLQTMPPSWLCNPLALVLAHAVFPRTMVCFVSRYISCHCRYLILLCTITLACWPRKHKGSCCWQGIWKAVSCSF